MNIKKIACLLLVAAYMLTLLTACGSEKESTKSEFQGVSYDEEGHIYVTLRYPLDNHVIQVPEKELSELLGEPVTVCYSCVQSVPSGNANFIEGMVEAFSVESGGYIWWSEGYCRYSPDATDKLSGLIRARPAKDECLNPEDVDQLLNDYGIKLNL